MTAGTRVQWNATWGDQIFYGTLITDPDTNGNVFIAEDGPGPLFSISWGNVANLTAA